MEVATEEAVQAAPVVTKNESTVTESSQESKVEQIANGKIESSVNTEKVVSQSVQSTVQATGDQTIQQNSIVEEVKQQSFSSSSVVVMRIEESSKEIQQESIKKQLNEIITDIEQNVHISNDESTGNSNDERLDGKKPIDLQKIFTPATDTEEILPGTNRKLFASSSFYSPSLHPTVEDQVELARRISHSLGDSNNQQSKGQSMYVNRKKRSVKWIHDDGREEERFVDEHQESNENGFESSTHHQEYQQIPHQNGSQNEPKKVPLKLLMDPRHVQDMNTMKQFGYEHGPMSPEYGYELVNALNAPNGKGAELFAKRRKKAEKWVVEGAIKTPSATPTPGSTISAYSDVGTQRVQLNMQMDQIQEKYQHPRVKMVQSPWEAALQTGSTDNAFVDYGQQQQQSQLYSGSAGQVQQYDYGQTTTSSSSYSSSKNTQYQSSQQMNLTGRDLAYRPSVPQGWNRPPVVLPAEFRENVIGEEAAESEMSEIYSSQQNYLELIRNRTPTPPLLEYQVRCGEVETNVYDEPIQELIIESDTKESTPEYQAVPVKSLINNFEQGMYTPAELPLGSSMTSSMTSEKTTKFSSTTSSSNFNEVGLPPQSAPLCFSQAPAPVAQAPSKPAQPAYNKPQQGFNKPQKPAYQPSVQQAYQKSVQQSYQQSVQQSYQQAQPAPYQSAPQSFVPQPQAVKTPPAVSPAPIKCQIPSPRPDNRSGLNASPVTPGILKKQILLDAAVPLMPGGIIPSTSSTSIGRSGGKSPVPFLNTAPAPFGFPAGSVQTPETIAQIAPTPSPLVPPYSNPKALPVILNTPLPNYSSSYNNAARPFNEFKDYYRPINMDSVNHKLLPPVVYTDF